MTAPVAIDAGAPAPPRRRRGAVLGAAIVAVVLLTAILSYRWGSGDTPTPSPTPTAEPTAANELSTAEIYSAIAASVVSIESVAAGDPSSGTGVIVNGDGTILTALHVVHGAETIRVRFIDGTESAATILAADPSMDIAALGAATLPAILVPAVLGSSDRIDVGDDVVAIGDQLGLNSSTTAGVVSGLNRGATSRDGTRLTGLIQFDAAVNPGSSGGPLVNTKGETIGIVVALANPTAAGTFIGIGFAVPIGAAVAAGSGEPPPPQ
jgi:putative serine protease PepD